MDIYQFAFGVVRNLVDVGFVSCTDFSALVGPHPGRYCQTLRVERMDGLRGDAGGDEEGAVAADVIVDRRRLAGFPGICYEFAELAFLDDIPLVVDIGRADAIPQCFEVDRYASKSVVELIEAWSAIDLVEPLYQARKACTSGQ